MPATEHLNDLATVVFLAMPDAEKNRLTKLFPGAVWTRGGPDSEALSVCCGAAEHEYVDGMCSGCNEMVKFEEVSIFNNLRCPEIESTKFLCDREASYQIDGTVYCQIHAQRLLSEKKNR